MQNIANSNALCYVGGIAGVNSGSSNARILNCNNYALISVTVLDEENESDYVNFENINIYAGFIAGSNLNKAVINRCKNYKVTNYDLNGGTKSYTLIVKNFESENEQSFNNYVGHTVGYFDSTSTVYEIVYDDSVNKNDLIYTKAKNSIYSVGK